MKSIKKEVIEAISNSKTLEEAAGKLGVSRRELFRMRQTFKIEGLECGKEEFQEPEDDYVLTRLFDKDFKKHNEVNSKFVEKMVEYTEGYRSANDIIREMKANDAAKLSIQNKSMTCSEMTVKVKPSHVIIADMQVTADNIDSCKKTLLAIANYVNKYKPTSIIWLGDFWDMVSLMNYKKGEFDSVAYRRDVDAGNNAMSYFQGLLTYKPLRQVFTYGNHEGRIGKAKRMDKSISAFIGYDDLNLKKFGVECYDFLLPVEVDGIFYCHYFSSGPMGKSIQSARMLLMKKHNNICQGHIQHFQQHIEILPNGRPITGLMAGCSYEHELDYLGPYQGTHYARQIWYCSDVSDGKFNPERIGMEVIRGLV